MDTLTTKEQLVNSNNVYPKVGYYELSKKLDLSINELMELLNVNNHNINEDNIIIHDENGNMIYFEDSNGDWAKYYYNENNELINETHSNTDCYKWYYDNK